MTWSRAFGRILGSSLEGVATVAACFLVGLASGAVFGGRIADRLNRPLLVYGSLEAAVGVWAVLGVLILPRGASLIQWAAPSDPDPWMIALAGFIFALAFLVPPTFLMGMTLPLLAAGAHRARAFVSGLGVLYGINTLGASVGAALAGFFLLPRLGGSGATLVAALTSLAVLALVIQEDAWVTAGSASFEPKPVPGAYRIWLLGPTFLVTGAVALSCEIAWTRGLGFILGSSTYSFSLILALFLLGIALGGFLWRAWSRAPLDPARAYGVILVILGLAIFGSIAALDRAADVFLYLYPRFATGRTGILLSFVGPAALTLLPAAIVLGFHFPLTGEILRAGGRASGDAAGHALLWNAAGALVGSLGAGFLFLPHFGTAGTLRAAGACALGLGLVWVAARLPLLRFRRLGIAAGGILLAIAVARFGPGLRRLLRDQGVYRFVNPTLAEQKKEGLRAYVRSRLAERRYLFEKEGRLDAVSVWHVGGNLVLALGGKADASYEDMETQVLLGQIPMLFAPRPRNGLVIGYGSGISARALLTHDLTDLRVAEIEPAVLSASRFFEHLTGRLVSRDGVDVVTADGRSLLTYSNDSYDLVVSEPSNPWRGANNALFTEEFYKLVRARLAPEGIFVQWFPAYETSGETIFVLLRTLESVFPDYFLMTSGADLIAVAGRDRLPRFSRAAWDRAPDEARAQLVRVGIGEPEDLFVRVVADSTLTLPAGPVNTDDNGWAEFRAPWELPLFAVKSEPVPKELSGASSPPLALWRRLGYPTDAAAVERLVRAALLRDDVPLARTVVDEWTGDKSPAMLSSVAEAEARHARRREVEVFFAEASQHLGRNEKALAVRKMEAAYELDPMNPMISGPLAFFLIEGGRLGEARALLQRELRRGVAATRVVTLLNLAVIEEREGRGELAEAYAREAVGFDPYRAEPHLFLSKLFERTGRAAEAAAILAEGARLNPDLPALKTK